MPGITCGYCESGDIEVLYALSSGSASFSRRGLYSISEDDFCFSDARVLKCRSCGLAYLFPGPDADYLRKAYEAMEDSLYLAEEKGRAKSARLLLNKLSRFKKPGRILDIGCASGIFLNEARKLGWEPYGVELSSWAVNYAKENFGIGVFPGNLEDAKYPAGYFDAIVMLDSIEHLMDPLGCLREAGRVLRDDGLLFISTPDIGSLLSRLMGRRWVGIKQSHLYYFNKRVISRILNDAGFKAVRFSRYTRFFSLNYLLLKLMPSKIRPKAKPLLDRLPFISSLLLTVNLGDQLEVCAVKNK
jgi:SAM-dependent methyltransferase